MVEVCQQNNKEENENEIELVGSRVHRSLLVSKKNTFWTLEGKVL